MAAMWWLFLLQTENVNRQAEGEAARSVTDAISLLGVSGGKSPDVDAHPERCTEKSHYDDSLWVGRMIAFAAVCCPSLLAGTSMMHVLSP